MKRIALTLALLTLTACGFKPLHSTEYRAKQGADLSMVDVQVDNSRLGQLLKAEITDGINPDFRAAKKLYSMRITLAEREIYLFINPDGTSSRGDIEYRTTYQLRRIADGTVLHSGRIFRVSSYNMAETADYASFVTEEDARKRGIHELAEDYRLRIPNLIANLEKGAAE